MSSSNQSKFKQTPAGVWLQNLDDAPSIEDRDRIRNHFGYEDHQYFFKNTSPGKELIPGALPLRGTVVLNGPAGCGKTYFILMLVWMLASGTKEFFNWRFNYSSLKVALFAYEGVHTLPGRMRAIEQHYGHSPPIGQLLIKRDPEKLTDADAFAQYQAELIALKVKVVVIDTLSAATAGIDEDKSKEMAPVVERVRKLSEAIDGLVVLITHPPKGNPNTPRGSNVLEGNTDGVINLRKKGKKLEIVPKKVRTSTPADPILLSFKPIDLGPDPEVENGRIIETVLTTSKPAAQPLELVLMELAEQGEKFRVAEVIDLATDRGLMSKSSAYRALDRMLPKDHEREIQLRTFRRTGSTIEVASTFKASDIE